jgi:hypothetical protein
MRNFLETPNPFGLSRPPAWFLREMGLYDPRLRMFISMEIAGYRLVRQTVRSAPIQVFADTTRTPDAVFCSTHGCIPAKTLWPNPTWSPLILHDLAAFDYHRHGGGRKVCDQLDERDRQRRLSLDAAQDDDCDQRSHSAYKAMKLRLGETVFVHDRQIPERVPHGRSRFSTVSQRGLREVVDGGLVDPFGRSVSSGALRPQPATPPGVVAWEAATA